MLIEDTLRDVVRGIKFAFGEEYNIPVQISPSTLDNAVRMAGTLLWAALRDPLIIPMPGSKGHEWHGVFKEHEPDKGRYIATVKRIRPFTQQHDWPENF